MSQGWSDKRFGGPRISTVLPESPDATTRNTGSISRRSNAARRAKPAESRRESNRLSLQESGVERARDTEPAGCGRLRRRVNRRGGRGWARRQRRPTWREELGRGPLDGQSAPRASSSARRRPLRGRHAFAGVAFAAMRSRARRARLVAAASSAKSCATRTQPRTRARRPPCRRRMRWANLRSTFGRVAR